MPLEFYFQYQSHMLDAKAEAAKQKPERRDSQLEFLQEQVERLSLASQAMWELLRDTAGHTEEALKAKMLEIDGRDGAVDGKIGYVVINCSRCQSKTSTKRRRCMICGEEIETGHLFKY